MVWLLITTIGKNPGDEWIRVGVENLIRQVDSDPAFILMDKEVPAAHETVIKFDKCIWCGMPVFWSLGENRNATISWWKELMLDWPSARKSDFLVLGAGSFFPWGIKGPEEIVYLAELRKSARDVIERSFFVTARDGVVAQMTGAPIPALICPAVFSILDFRQANDLKLANLMPLGSHYKEFGAGESAVWDSRKLSVAKILRENGFVFVAHRMEEVRFAQQLGWERIICYNGDPYELLKFYGRCGKFFGNRIHGAIVARGNNADAWCVGYDSRMEAVRLSGAKVSKPSELNLEQIAQWASSPIETKPFDMDFHFKQQVEIVRRFALSGGAAGSKSQAVRPGKFLQGALKGEGAGIYRRAVSNATEITAADTKQDKCIRQNVSAPASSEAPAAKAQRLDSKPNAAGEQAILPEEYPALAKEAKKVLIVRPDSIGDFVIFSGILKNFKDIFPKASISILVQAHIAELAENCPYIDSVIAFTKKSLFTDETYTLELLRRLRSENFDVAINPVYSRDETGDFLTLNCEAKTTIASVGDYSNISAEEKAKNDSLYTKLVAASALPMVETSRNEDFIRGLGIELSEPAKPQVWITDEDRAAAQRLLSELKAEKPVVICPVSQFEIKNWPVYKWTQLVNYYKDRPVLICGSKQDYETGEQIIELTGHQRIYNLCGRTGLRELAAVLEQSCVCISVDSAAIHIAAAVGCPNVVIVGGGHFGRFAPYSPLTSVVCLPLRCYGCNWDCQYKTAHCVEGVRWPVATEAVRQTLGKPSDRPRVFVQDAFLMGVETGGPKWEMFDKFLDTNAVEIIHIGEAAAEQMRLSSSGVKSAKQKGNGIVIVTSIAPKEVGKQARAIGSWRRLGFDVVSINCGEEIEILQEDFPEVNFVEAKRDARGIFDKPFIYLDDILEYIRQADCEVCGIVNSDIFLSGGDSIVSFIRSEARNSLIYGSRIEVDSPANLAGEVYENGFDFFFFDKSIVSHFPKSDFCIGATWWDYWMPLASVLAGCEAKRLVTPFAYHIKHSCKWDEKQWFLLGGKLYGHLRERICERLASNSLAGRWDLLARMLSTYAHFFIKKIENVRDKDEYTKILYESSGPCILEFLEIESQTIGRADRQKVKSANSADYTGMDITVGISYEDYQKAVELNRYGEYLLNKGDTEGSRNAFTEALRILPNFTAGYNNIGILYMRKDQPTDALKYFVKALKIDSLFIPAIINSAAVLIRGGKVEAARGLVRNSAQKFMDSGKPAKAAEIYKAYLWENPGDNEVVKALKNLGCADEIKSSTEDSAKTESCGKSSSYDRSAEPARSAGGRPAGEPSAASRYLVSAIVSTYNAEKNIRGCLEDLESQTTADWMEIIVVNSGSEQNEEQIVREFQEKYGNIKYIRTEQREGIYAAWNRAVKVAEGQFLTNANTDDRHSKDALKIMAKTLLANPEIALVYGDQIITKTPNDTFDNHHGVDFARRPEYSRERLLFGCCVGSQPMWQRRLHNEFGYFDETLDSAGDWEFWLRISQKYRFLHIPEFLGLYFFNEDGIEHGRKIHSLYERYLVGKRYGNPYISVIPIYQHKDNPLVSVVMPAYNATRFIRSAIESVLIQNYRNFELIVVDDGSTDGTEQVVSEFRDENIKYFHKANGGAASARNFGVKNAAGTFFVFLDADDMMTPDFISSHLAEFDKRPDADIIYCDDLLIDVRDKPIRVIKRPEYTERKFLVRDLFRCGFPVVAFKCCIRKEVFEKIGFYEEGLQIAEDYDMVRRAVKNGLVMHHLNAPLYFRRMSGGSLSATFTIDKAKCHFKVLKRFTDTFGYDELFPDVRWERIEPAKRQLHGRTLTALTYLTIGQAYTHTGCPIFAWTARQMACYELKRCLDEDPGNERLQQMLKKCEMVLKKSPALQNKAVYQTT